jgi:hypothetical protein
VSLRYKGTGEKVGAGTSFYTDQTCRQVHRIRKQLLAIEALFDDDVTFLAQANQVKNGLSYIDAANVRCHGRASFARLKIVPQLILQGDGPSHYTKRQKSFRNIAKTYRQPKAKCNTFLQREMLAFQ